MNTFIGYAREDVQHLMDVTGETLIQHTVTDCIISSW